MNIDEIKKRLLQVQDICNKCDVYSDYDKKPCKEIPISDKICSGIGCGLWKKDGKSIISQQVYDGLQQLGVIKMVINDIKNTKIDGV